MQQKPDIIFEEIPGREGNLGLITLNRPEVLNALNHNMFLMLDRQLTEWAVNDAIKAVVIRAAEGRAFCAGGDIRYAYERGLAKDPTLPNFFRDEYRVDQQIYHYPKPYIALLDGITMGGGVGISIHGSHRVATPRFIFAMPETSIGFFPDVGATYFLPRLPGKIGTYLALTGTRVSHSDSFALGIVNHVVASESFPDILQLLADTPLHLHTDATITDLINQFSMPVEKATVMDHLVEIDTCFSKSTMDDVMSALEHYPSAWCEQVVSVLSTKSPTSLKVTLRQMQEGVKMNFDECMQLELQLTKHFLHSHDFFEGVRAVIIDKDQSPKWKPAKLEEVTAADIEKFFMPQKISKGEML